MNHLDIRSGFDDFAGNFVTEHQPGWRCRAPSDHMLVGAADIGGDDLENDAVVNLPAIGCFHSGVVDPLDFNMIGAKINDPSVFVRHGFSPGSGSGHPLRPGSPGTTKCCRTETSTFAAHSGTVT
ncbi:hypothetical protein [Gluconobacter cerinus]|nr:hypothetical protein [Gluconobacter cerinus]